MTDSQRRKLPDSIRTNGATPNPWWANAVVYQVYPRSFKDSNGDGLGDLKGIEEKLDYLARLGVDVIWLSPVYKSPQDDNGYDIADYYQIDPLFGTLDDMDSLLVQAHRRGIRVVMDLVVNHTSDENEWFRKSVRREPGYEDWYWWEPAKEGHEPGTPGAEPNLWGGSFGGSAWQYCPQRGEYYLHTFSCKQPDLKWENPQVRQAVYRMMNWWLDRGIDGFRMDVITLISKRIDSQGRLPGVRGSEIEDLPAGPEGYSSPWPFSMDGPRLDEYLKEMRSAVFEGRQGYLTVGEAQGISPERNAVITSPDSKELDMLFLFDHLEIDQEGTKWNSHPLELGRLKAAMKRQQEAVGQTGWTSLFFNNHDQPRALSRWGQTSSESLRVRSAKALGLLLHMHRGTPYIYEGEEIGMTNAGFTRLDQYRDLESINAYRQRVQEAGLQTPESMLASLAKVSRDNSRTPMQWDSSEYAGFCPESSGKEPWLAVNPNKDQINVDSQIDDPDSVFSFYRKLIDLRHTNPVVSSGSFSMLDEEDGKIYSFRRDLGDREILVLVNMSNDSTAIPAQSSQELEQHQQAAASRQVLLSNLSDEAAASCLDSLELEPWAAMAVTWGGGDGTAAA